MKEPLFDSNEIQGHILPGFGTNNINLIGFRVVNPIYFSQQLLLNLELISTMHKSMNIRKIRKTNFIRFNRKVDSSEIQLAISFSNIGLQFLNTSTNEFNDSSFINGMYASAEGLNDRINSRSNPEKWIVGNANSVIHGIFVLGGDNKIKVENFKEELSAIFDSSIEIVYDELGSKLPEDKEHFGFRDGISQPAVRGKINPRTYLATRNIDSNDVNFNILAKPGQPLIWPGQFLFGFQSESNNPKEPGPIRYARPEWIKNGSFLVFRRLSQDVKLFRNTFQSISEDIYKKFGVTISVEKLMANSVGRWRDGTPLTISPDKPNTNISENRNLVNHFNFLNDTPDIKLKSELGEKIVSGLKNDNLGLRCPYFSHIRKINPRDDGTDIGTEKTNQKLILRRGIPFGKLYDENEEVERGLLFLSYQTSIKEQFEFLQRNWANAATRPAVNGHDFIIGKSGKINNQRVAKFIFDQLEIKINAEKEWVFTTGGGYFFTPSMSGLKYILSQNSPSFV